MSGWQFVFVFATLFFTARNSSADEDFLGQVTFNRTENARIVYTGVLGVAFDEFGDYSYGAWRDSIQLRYVNGMMTESEHHNAIVSMSLRLSEIRNGRWWDRSVFDSMPVEKGGAKWPPDIYYVGPRDDLVNTRLFRITNTFKFKLKDYTTTISGDFDETARRFAEDGWRFRFSPAISTGTTSVNSISCAIVFNYFMKDRDLLKLEMSSGYSKRHRAYLYFEVSIARW